jgi:putative inorganic carbon (HCO3(-)) transporter
MNLDINTLLSLAILGLFLFAVAVSRPELGLSALIIVVYANLSEVLIARFGFPSITQPLIGLLGVVILARRIIFQDNFEGWQQLVVLLGIYTFLGYMSIFYASDQALVVETLVYNLKNAVIGLVIIFLLQKKPHLTWVIWSLLFSGIFMGTISTYQVLTGTYGNAYWGFGQAMDDGGGTYRLEGSIGDANYYAQIMVVLVPIAVERFLHEKKLILRFLAGFGIFVLLATIYYTLSRGGFLALLVVAFLIMIRQPSRHYTGFILIGIMLLASYRYMPSEYTERISTLSQVLPDSRTSARKDVSLEERRAANIIGWKMFTDHPVFGVGVGNYNSNLVAYARQLGLVHNVTSAHNLYLEVAAERGIFGFLSFMAIIYATFRVLQRTKESCLKRNFLEMVGICEALTAGLVGYLVTAAFLHDAYIRYLWLLLGIAWSMPQVLRSLSGGQSPESRVNSLKKVAR